MVVQWFISFLKHIKFKTSYTLTINVMHLQCTGICVLTILCYVQKNPTCCVIQTSLLFFYETRQMKHDSGGLNISDGCKQANKQEIKKESKKKESECKTEEGFLKHVKLKSKQSHLFLLAGRLSSTSADESLSWKMSFISPPKVSPVLPPLSSPLHSFPCVEIINC